MTCFWRNRAEWFAVWVCFVKARWARRSCRAEDILPTGFECAVLNGQVKPGDTMAIVGAGPIGLAVLLTAQFYSPGAVFMIDLDDNRSIEHRHLPCGLLV